MTFRTFSTSGNIQGSSDTSGMTLWHTGILLILLAHWHSRQAHGTGRLMMIHQPLNLVDSGTQMWSVSQDEVDAVDVVDANSEAE